MGFLAFVKFALICFDSVACPLFALGYPLRASIQAIETNSNSDMKKLVTYWVIFALISLFEHAFMVMLQWLPFWLYMKVTIVCWMMIPNFDGALYVYNHLVHPCLYLDVQTMVCWFRKEREFLPKDNFLAEADEYVKVHGPEPLEKLIASESKGTEPCILQKDIKPVQITEKREVSPVNLIPETEPNAAQTVNNMSTAPEIEPLEKLIASKSKDTEPCILQKDIKPVQVTEKREVSPVNLIPETEPSAAQTVNNVITAPEIDRAAAYTPPEIPSEKQVQKEWTCAMCQVTTTSEKTLYIHLQGRRHMNACEKLSKAKNQPAKGKETSPQKRASSTTNQATQKKQKPSKGQASATSAAKNSDLPSDNASTSSKAPKTGTIKSNQPKEEPKKLPPNNSAGNQPKRSEKVQGQQQAAKKDAENKVPQFCCTICNISCSRSEDLNCHLLGRKHLARIQELNRLGRSELA